MEIPINYHTTLISIIIPFYNREADTINAVESVLAQTYANWELILLNDGSDESIDTLCKAIEGNERIRLIHLPKSGVAIARNHGLTRAKGDFIAFLDSDDLFDHRKLEWQLAAMHSQQAVFSHTSYVEKQKYKDGTRVVNAGTFTGKVFPEIISRCPIATPTVMIHRSLCDKADFFPVNFHIGEDICAWIRISSEYDIIGIDIPLSTVNVNQESAINRPEKQIEGLKNIIHFVESDPGLTRRCYKQLIELYDNISVNYRKIAGQSVNDLGYLKSFTKNKFVHAGLVMLDSALRKLVLIRRKITNT